ncbi:hypothetical protein Trydic_g11025 [Trypoxylus dichotomus]
MDIKQKNCSSYTTFSDVEGFHLNYNLHEKGLHEASKRINDVYRIKSNSCRKPKVVQFICLVSFPGNNYDKEYGKKVRVCNVSEQELTRNLWKTMGMVARSVMMLRTELKTCFRRRKIMQSHTMWHKI